MSVIIATYNRAALLGETLESAIRQSFQDFEIIVVDDGSTDDTARRMATFESRVSYVRLEHSGHLGHVRNRGIELAQGTMIAFLDDDDLWLPHKLEQQVLLLQRDPGLGMVYSDVRILQPDGSLSGPVLSPAQRRAEGCFKLLLATCFVHPSTVVVRRALLEQVGRFDESLRTLEDYDCWLRLAHTAGAGCAPEPLVVVRRHSASHSQQSEIANYRNAILVLERALKLRPLTAAQRMRCRATLARWNAHLGLLLEQNGERSDARQYLLRSLRWNPLQRRAWSELTGHVRGGG